MYYPYEWISYQWKAPTQCWKPLSHASPPPNVSDYRGEKSCFVVLMNDNPNFFHNIRHLCLRGHLFPMQVSPTLNPSKAPHVSLGFFFFLTDLKELPLSPVSLCQKRRNSLYVNFPTSTTQNTAKKNNKKEGTTNQGTGRNRRTKMERVKDKREWEREHLVKTKGQTEKKSSQNQNTHKAYNSPSCLGEIGKELSTVPLWCNRCFCLLRGTQILNFLPIWRQMKRGIWNE